MKHVIRLLIFLALFCSCGSNPVAKEGGQESNDASNLSKANTGDRQLNINILWDLSDRIDTVSNPASPQYYERDIQAIQAFASFFKKDMEKRGAFKAKGRIRVFFNPVPTDSRINAIAADLSCDLSAFAGSGGNRKKKELHDSIESRFTRNALSIYQLAVSERRGKKQWDGSDVWRFFKNDVKEYCIEPSGNYRNILVILTDGYIYHRDSKDKQGKRTAYILPDVLKTLRNSADWKQVFVRDDYGLISTRKDLQDLEVLVLGINPSKGFKNDEDIIKAYLGKWFEEMQIPQSNYACYNTDLPEYSRSRIEAFLNRQ